MILRLGIRNAKTRRFLRHFWDISQARPHHIVVPLVLALMAIAVEAASYGLLIPLSDAVSENGFSFLEGSRFFAWIGSLVPEAVLESPKRDAYLALAVLMLVVVGRSIKVLIDYARQRFIHRRDEGFTALAKEKTFERLMGFGRLYFDRRSLGRVETELGWAGAPASLIGGAEELLRRVFSIVAKAVVMFVLSPVLFFAAILAYPAIQFSVGWIHRAVADLSRRNADLQRDMQSEVLDLISTVPLVKGLRQEGQSVASYRSILEDKRDLSIRQRDMMALRWPSEEILILGIVLLAQATIIFTAGSFRVGDLARLAAFLLLVQQTLPELKAYGGFRMAIAECMPRLEALADIFDDDGKHIVVSGPRDFPGLSEGISIRNLTFSYTDGVTVLRDLSAELPARKMTALVGESGAGKTTLVDLVTRAYECPPNTIYLDGVDIREISLDSLYERMTIVSQDVWLFNRTLRQNMVFGLPDPPDDDLLLELLHELDLRPPTDTPGNLLDIQIGDRGVQLSGGQRQRLALARGILRDPDILVLDEATSALDSIVEARVEKIIERRSRDRTLIVIAHRLSTIRDADQILVLKDGQVVERGTWDDLLVAGGEFARLHQAQFREESGARAERMETVGD